VSRGFSTVLIAFPALLALSGCGYVHLGRLPVPVTQPTILGDEQLIKDNSDLRFEKKMLQQELALTRAQGDALRMAIENRAADGDTSKRLVEKLNETSRELATLRSNYAKLQLERNTAVASAGQATALQAKLADAENKLASSLRNFTELQNEVTQLRTDVARTREENVALGEQVKTVTAQNTEAQTALAQLNTDLLAQKEARAQAEQDADTLRTELKTVAPNSSVLAQQRTGSAGQVRSLVAEQAAESQALKQQLDQLRDKVSALETERTQLQQQLAAGGPNLLADLQALRQENAQLKAAHQAAPSTLQEQVRSTQARADALTEENARAKAKLGQAPRPVTIIASEPTRIELGSDQPAPASNTAVTAPNVTGSSVNAMLVASVPGAGRNNAKADPASARVHVVSGGDTLAKISALYYGTPGRWGDILAANRDVLGESNNLVVGRSIRIP
jgi:nucleoid-associated protein YgaU